MDSGASASVASASTFPEYETRPSEGSIAGQEFVSASGEVLPNQGEQHVEVVTDEGIPMVTRYQNADVQRPLNAISEFCDAGGIEGQYVIFSKWGGVVWNPETHRKIPFDREGGIYHMGMWVKPRGPEATGFTGQGVR